MNIGKSKKPMPCPCTGPKSFWAGPFFFVQEVKIQIFYFTKKNKKFFKNILLILAP